MLLFINLNLSSGSSIDASINFATSFSTQFGSDNDIFADMTFTSNMSLVEAKQLLGEANITFGTIQNIQVSGSNFQFEILTPDFRTFKVYIEDRTIVVDSGTRITTILRT